MISYSLSIKYDAIDISRDDYLFTIKFLYGGLVVYSFSPLVVLDGDVLKIGGLKGELETNLSCG